MCNREIAVNISAATETRKHAFFQLVCLLPFADPVSLHVWIFFFFMYITKSGDYCFGKKASVPYHTEQEKRNLAERKAALPAVLSDFG